MSLAPDPSLTVLAQRAKVVRMEQSNATQNGIKLLGERLLPGASLMMDGKIAAGGAHTVVSTLARLLLGPTGVALVALNSFSNSVSGGGILKQLRRDQPNGEAEASGDVEAGEAAKP